MRWVETFPAEPPSARLARQFVQDLLSELDGECMGSVVLMVDELATNAILHGEGSHFVLRVERQHADGVVRVEVRDLSRKPPVPLDWGRAEEHGHGLHIVARLADRWGWTPVPGGKITWFEHSPPAR